MPYSPMLVKPMREELTQIGVKELLTPADVDALITALDSAWQRQEASQGPST